MPKKNLEIKVNGKPEFVSYADTISCVTKCGKYNIFIVSEDSPNEEVKKLFEETRDKYVEILTEQTE